jgi:phage shock protein C
MACGQLDSKRPAIVLDSPRPLIVGTVHRGFSMADFRAPLRRSRENRMVAGVVAGLANYFGIDVTLARVVFVVVSIISVAFPGIIVYIARWVLIPEEERGL